MTDLMQGESVGKLETEIAWNGFNSHSKFAQNAF